MLHLEFAFLAFAAPMAAGDAQQAKKALVKVLLTLTALYSVRLRAHQGRKGECIARAEAK